MKAAPLDDAFFQADLLLLVEDARTRVVLGECWSSGAARPSVVVRAVGGGSAVRALVQAAREQGRRTVFGLRDADFGGLGAFDQRGPDFRLPVHELENLLLDFEVLSSLASGAAAREIEDAAHRKAETMVPWMATCRVLRELRTDHPPFPEHPSVAAMATPDLALSHLRSLRYGESLRRNVVQKWTDEHLQTLLGQYLKDYARELADGRWVQTFAGKEIFEHLHASAGIRWRSPRATGDDLAKMIASAWSRGSAPVFITWLRARMFEAVGGASRGPT